MLASSADLVQAHAALARRDWPAANRAIRSHFLRRPPRFLIDPGARASVADAGQRLFPAALEAATRRADQVQRGRYDLLGYRDLSFSDGKDATDWHADPVHGRRAPAHFWARVPYLDPQLGDLIVEVFLHFFRLLTDLVALGLGESQRVGQFGAKIVHLHLK